MPQPLLFNRANIHDVLLNQQEHLRAEVRGLTAAAVRQVSEQELVTSLASKFKLELPVLEYDLATSSHEEVQVDVSHDPTRRIFDRGRPFHVAATEIVVAIPFRGDGGLFDVRPGTFTTNPPRGEVNGNELVLKFTQIQNDAAALKRDYDQAINAIKQYLAWLEIDVMRFNSQIGTQTASLVAERCAQVRASEELAGSLGLPARRGAGPGAPSRSEQSIRKTVTSPKKWDVFISHASEDKAAFVRQLAEALRAAGLQVWYDEFSLKLGDSLRGTVDFGIANSRYGVVVLSNAFFEKQWPQNELDGLSSREVNGQKVILPIWHQIDRATVALFSPMLSGRLAAQSSDGVPKVVEQILAVLDESA